MNKINTENELKLICKALAAAQKHELSIEFIRSALHYLKQHPNETIASAIQHALNEWDL